ncbi:MAG: hypothetical protein KGL29_15450 [Alphaproteobacteria bacterium]|nr:hypothetical protein [Alphaproteobacteria bacterium]MDE1987432.1 hypothetical protein [Alphaproteobacteria bacterium]MDE2164244.1 hypothetical protein [Alphaproteobacteria bacterium]MDE2267298.1 hypothetical protein [Alphaproteobacteria bacterium]
MKTCKRTGRGPYARAHPNYWLGVTAEDIPQGWMDDMIKRLFEELNREMIRIESKSRLMSDKPENVPACDRTEEAQDLRLRKLQRVQHMLRELTQMELQRKTVQDRKVTPDDDDPRAALERRLDERLAAIEALETAEKSGQE